MDNHYHLVFKTPEPNLVAGMKWLQNTWTKRFNARHRQWGHLFGGRYTSVLVEDNEHVAVLIDYVHLNPFRAGLVKGRAGLEDCRWSSLADYLRPARQRPEWLRAERGLALRGYADTAAGRRRYLAHLEELARDEAGLPGAPGGDGRTLQSTLRRGWWFGAEGFREKMVALLGKVKGRGGRAHQRVSGYTGEQAREHGEAMAGKLLVAGLRAAGLRQADLATLPKGDWRKRVIGRLIRRHTTVPLGWVAANLAMGVTTRVSTLVGAEPTPAWGKNWKPARRLMAALDQTLRNVD
jgi:hypothetical protein